MPLVYQQNINFETRIGVWHIQEPEDFFLHKVIIRRDITHPHKRLQHLAGRYMLLELFPDFPLELILIADTKKPFLVDEAYHFSISHCGDYVAVIVSKTQRVGTDIEIPQDKIKRISKKFLKENELGLMAQVKVEEEQFLTACWSIKEAIFKWYGAGKVDFRAHIDIVELKMKDEQILATCMFTRENEIKLKVQGLWIHSNCLTWIINRP